MWETTPTARRLGQMRAFAGANRRPLRARCALRKAESREHWLRGSYLTGAVKSTAFHGVGGKFCPRQSRPKGVKNCLTEGGGAVTLRPVSRDDRPTMREAAPVRAERSAVGQEWAFPSAAAVAASGNPFDLVWDGG